MRSSIMKLSRALSGSVLACVGAAAFNLCISAPLQAQNAAAAYSGYNSAFLVQNGQTFYNTAIGNTTADREWSAAVDIDVALDAYRYSRTQANLNLLTSLMNSLTYYNSAGGPYGNWQTDGWDDNVEWMVNAYIQAYLLTGNTAYLTEAEGGWNAAYKQGWDTTYNGGGIWEKVPKSSKCGLSNNPFVWEGAELTLATGDGSYLTKAETVYAWVRSTLVNTTSSNNSLGAPGQVNGCVNPDGSIQSADNLYDQGSFIEAAVQLYKMTGNSEYSDDALRTIDHVQGKGSIIPYGGGESGHQWQYWFTRGLSDYATATGTWGTYDGYLQNNANAAWNQRDGTYNITWNDWTNPTSLTSADPNEMSSAAAIWQHLPPPVLNLSGTWQIQNVNSGLALNVAGNSKASKAAIQQYSFISGQTNSEWTFQSVGGGFYQILNVNSGMAVNVTGGSGLKGSLIIQYPAGGPAQGNDYWYVVKNSDNTYSFYNLNSYQALDVPNNSKTSGVQLDQWFGNFGANQKFNLIAE
jgi:hypothetical protein